jgi:hypothetical protein
MFDSYFYWLKADRVGEVAGACALGGRDRVAAVLYAALGRAGEAVENEVPEP